MSRIQNLHKAATRYRKRERLTGGVVIFNAGLPTGWMNTLRDPHAWQPGVKAVDADGNLWTAWGGDEYGAESWRQLNG